MFSSGFVGNRLILEASKVIMEALQKKLDNGEANNKGIWWYRAR